MAQKNQRKVALLNKIQHSFHDHDHDHDAQENEISKDSSFQNQIHLLLARIYITFDGSSKSLRATIMSSIITTIMLIAFLVCILQSQPAYQSMPQSCLLPVCNDDPNLCPGKMICEPNAWPILDDIERWCIYVFTIEYGTRLLTCCAVNSRQAHILPWGWDEQHETTDPIPVYPLYEHYFRYVFSLRSLVDLASFVSFYFNSSQNPMFVRVLRLARIYKVFNVFTRLKRIQSLMTLLIACMETSIPALVVMAMFLAISLIFFGAIIYELEVGKFTVTADYPLGVFLRPTIDHYGMEISPYNSVATSIYFVATTVTTVGYGDITPTSGEGRAVACMIMFCGILTLALPVGVISSNFGHLYEAFLELEAIKNQTMEQPDEKVSIFGASTKVLQRYMGMVPHKSSRQVDISCDDDAAAVADSQRFDDADLNEEFKSDPFEQEKRNIAREPSIREILRLNDQKLAEDSFEEPEEFVIPDAQMARVKKMFLNSNFRDLTATDSPHPPEHHVHHSIKTELKELIALYTEEFGLGHSAAKPHTDYTKIQDPALKHFMKQLVKAFMIADGSIKFGNRNYVLAFNFIFSGVVLLSVLSYIVSSTPYVQQQPAYCSEPACNDDPFLCPGRMVCQPIPDSGFSLIDDLSLFIFAFEYLFRISVLWAVDARDAHILPLDWYHEHGPDDPIPKYPLYEHYFRYIIQVHNLIDLATFLPFFILWNHRHSVNSTSTKFLRVLRLFRVFKLFNTSKLVQDMSILIVATLAKSFPALVVMVLLSFLGMIFFGALMYAIEGGRFTATPDYPDGVYMRTSISGVGSIPSTFRSIPSGMYWAITTGITVGYGDMYPTNPIGRTVAAILMFLGNVVIGLPIGIISSNFTQLYQEYYAEKKESKEAQSILKVSEDENKRHAILSQIYNVKDFTAIGEFFDPSQTATAIGNTGQSMESGATAGNEVGEASLPAITDRRPSETPAISTTSERSCTSVPFAAISHSAVLVGREGSAAAGKYSDDRRVVQLAPRVSVVAEDDAHAREIEEKSKRVEQLKKEFQAALDDLQSSISSRGSFNEDQLASKMSMPLSNVLSASAFTSAAESRQQENVEMLPTCAMQ